MSKYESEAFGQLLGGTARAWRLKLDQRLRPIGLSQAKWRTLLYLSDATDPLTQTQVAERLGIEEPSLVTLLHRLEEGGWVARRSSANDRRCKTVHLKNRAHKLIAQINQTARRLRHELIDGIPARDLRVCIRVLEKIQERAENAPANVRGHRNGVIRKGAAK